MSREGTIHFACLYGPLFFTFLLAFWLRPRRRFATGILFALAWNAALLPWLDGLARFAGLWSYHFQGPAIGGMPLSFYFGWIIAWGCLGPMLAKVLGGRNGTVLAILTALDLLIMPEIVPVLRLQPGWFVGEAVLIAVLLAPSMWLCRWTETRQHTGVRSAMLALCFGGIVIGLPMILILGDLENVLRHWQSQAPHLQVALGMAAFLFAVPGLTAMRDLARSGDGTPVPLDPPGRLVTHGIYSYLRNPMQVSMTTLLIIESAFINNSWPLILALLGIVYSEGFARWSEGEEMPARFGKDWTRYCRSIRPWLPRWKPRIGEPCSLYLDTRCTPCSEVWKWFERREPEGLSLRPADQWPGNPLKRVTWHHASSGRTESGVAAIAMGLQHLNLGWALIGWLAGLPGISHLLGVCFDAAGAGPRKT